MDILLASKSPTRAKLLKSARINFTSIDHGVDEDEVKLSMGLNKPKEIAIKLSELKAVKVSSVRPDSFVIGSDQVLDFEGNLFNKAADKEDALKQLKALSGKEHTLITSTTVAQNNKIIWRHLDETKMKMRDLKSETIKKYVDEISEETLSIVGVYAIEEEGIKLFESITGDIFSIQGLSMLPLMQFFWNNNILFNNND